MNKAGIVVLGLALAGLGFGICQWRNDPFDAQALIERPSAQTMWSDTSEKALRRITRDTRCADRWQIGQLPREGMVSLILIDSDRIGGVRLTSGLTNNCTYTGEQGLIICDVALVRKLLSDRDLDKTVVSPYDADGHVITKRLQPLDQAALQGRYQTMLEWILGHELGHILNGHRRAHFSSDRLEDPVSPASIDQEKELNADAFLARQFDGTSDMDFYFFLIGILQSEINRKACPDRSSALDCPNIQVRVLIFSPNDYVRYSRKGTHPEFIIRMDRLLILADEKHDLGIIGPLARGLKAKLLSER